LSKRYSISRTAIHAAAKGSGMGSAGIGEFWPRAGNPTQFRMLDTMLANVTGAVTGAGKDGAALTAGVGDDTFGATSAAELNCAVTVLGDAVPVGVTVAAWMVAVCRTSVCTTTGAAAGSAVPTVAGVLELVAVAAGEVRVLLSLCSPAVGVVGGVVPGVVVAPVDVVEASVAAGWTPDPSLPVRCGRRVPVVASPWVNLWGDVDVTDGDPAVPVVVVSACAAVGDGVSASAAATPCPVAIAAPSAAAAEPTRNQLITG
jgi:hypothetical protein